MVGMRERIAIMTAVEMAPRFGGRLRPRNRRGGRRIRRRAITGRDEGDIDISVLAVIKRTRVWH